MKNKAPSYLRQLAQPVPVGGTVLSVPRRAQGRVSEKFGLAGVPVIQEAEETIVAQLQRLRTQEAALDVRGERERSVSAEAVPQGKQKPAQTMEAERVDAVKDAAVEMRREVLRVERERVIESEVRSLEAKPQRTPQPAAPIEAKAAEQRTTIHIGTVEVRVITPAPPAPAPIPQRTMESQPARLGPPTPAPSLSRSLAWNYGLVQG